MAKSVSDILPEQFIEPDEQAPVQILRELGKEFGRRMSRKLIARVSSRSLEGGKFVHNFIIAAPALDYEGALLRVTNTDSLYPAEISGNVIPDSPLTAESADDLIDKLSAVFHSPKTTQVINSLLAQLE